MIYHLSKCFSHPFTYHCHPHSLTYHCHPHSLTYHCHPHRGQAVASTNPVGVDQQGSDANYWYDNGQKDSQSGAQFAPVFVATTDKLRRQAVDSYQ